MKKKCWKSLIAACILVLGTAGVKTAAADSATLDGNGIQVRFDEAGGTVSLYRYQEDEGLIQMSQPSCVSYPVIAGQALSDFTDFDCQTETNVEGAAGPRDRMTLTSRSESTGLVRICELETVKDVPGLLYVRTTYRAEGDSVDIQKFVDCEFALESPAQTVWSYNGGGEGQQSYYDTLQKIDLSDSQTFHRDNRQDDTSAGVPAADIYSENGGIAVGDASVTRRELFTPVDETAQTVKAAIQRPARTIVAGETAKAGEGFVQVHGGDYYMGLRGYANGMKKLGFSALEPEQIPQNSYDLRWESWGWEFDWTLELILGKLDELQRIGIKQVTLDDGWYNNAGEWGLNPNKLPNGSADMKRLTDEIHKRGMTALLWWRPCDGGREDSKLYKEHPEYFVKNEDGTIGKLSGPGQSGSFNGSTGYALCPGSEGAIQSQVDFVKTALNEWGFDGLKSDYVWSIPHCYNPAHNHERPEESTEGQAVFYREIYRAMKECKEDAFHLLCNCGTPQDFYSLPYVTQIPTADPTSVDQTRRRVKAYKALCGDYFPVTTDHNEIWYPSAVGTGAVLIEKRNMTGSAQQEYERWLEIAEKEDLQRGQFVGDLYSYGFDPYETYVVNKDGVMHYAFYKDGAKYKPEGNPEIELKGLNPYKMYRIVDYVNDRVIATNVLGSRAVFSVNFSEYLLLRAEELTAVEPVQNEVTVEESDTRLIYEGNWTSEPGDAFSGGASKYTEDESASVSLTFEGDSIAWYGQKDENFGTARVSIDGVAEPEVECRGAAATGVKLFEKSGLGNGKHTIKIECISPVIDIDRLVYTQTTGGDSNSASDIADFASFYDQSNFAGGSGWEAFQEAKNSLEMLLNDGNAKADEIKEAQASVLEAALALRREVRKELIGSAAILPEDTEGQGQDIGTLYTVVCYAEAMDVQNMIPTVKTLFDTALQNAKRVLIDPEADQNDINRAWAELLDKIQYAAYTVGDRTELTRLLGEYQKLDLSLYQNAQAFENARREAQNLLLDENALDYELQAAVSRLQTEKGKLVLKVVDKGTQKLEISVNVKPQKKALKVTWGAQEGSVSCTVYLLRSGKWQNVGTTTKTSFSIKKLRPGTKYQVKVAFQDQQGNVQESKVCYTATKPQKPKIKKVQKYRKTGLKITCVKKGVSGFEAWVKKGKKPYRKAAAGAKALVLKKGIRTGGNVSVKVRAYIKNKDAKIYGAYRKIKF